MISFSLATPSTLAITAPTERIINPIRALAGAISACHLAVAALEKRHF